MNNPVPAGRFQTAHQGMVSPAAAIYDLYLRTI